MGPDHHSQVATYFQMVLGESLLSQEEICGEDQADRTTRQLLDLHSSQRPWDLWISPVAGLERGSAVLTPQAESLAEKKCGVIRYLSQTPASSPQGDCISGSTRTTQIPLQDHTSNKLKRGGGNASPEPLLIQRAKLKQEMKERVFKTRMGQGKSTEDKTVYLHRGTVCTYTPKDSQELAIFLFFIIIIILSYLAPAVYQTLEQFFSESVCANLGLCYSISHYTGPRGRERRQYFS